MQFTHLMTHKRYQKVVLLEIKFTRSSEGQRVKQMCNVSTKKNVALVRNCATPDTFSPAMFANQILAIEVFYMT